MLFEPIYSCWLWHFEQSCSIINKNVVQGILYDKNNIVFRPIN